MDSVTKLLVTKNQSHERLFKLSWLNSVSPPLPLKFHLRCFYYFKKKKVSSDSHFFFYSRICFFILQNKKSSPGGTLNFINVKYLVSFFILYFLCFSPLSFFKLPCFANLKHMWRQTNLRCFFSWNFLYCFGAKRNPWYLLCMKLWKDVMALNE